MLKCCMSSYVHPFSISWNSLSILRFPVTAHKFNFMHSSIISVFNITTLGIIYGMVIYSPSWKHRKPYLYRNHFCSYNFKRAPVNRVRGRKRKNKITHSLLTISKFTGLRGKRGKKVTELYTKNMSLLAKKHRNVIFYRNACIIHR